MVAHIGVPITPHNNNVRLSDALFHRVVKLTFPGIHVSVVNSYPAATDSVSVSSFSREDFPTLGKPIIATRPSPLLATSKP